jgi:hypothetical protein
VVLRSTPASPKKEEKKKKEEKIIIKDLFISVKCNGHFRFQLG